MFNYLQSCPLIWCSWIVWHAIHDTYQILYYQREIICTCLSGVNDITVIAQSKRSTKNYSFFFLFRHGNKYYRFFLVSRQPIIGCLNSVHHSVCPSSIQPRFCLVHIFCVVWPVLIEPEVWLVLGVHILNMVCVVPETGHCDLCMLTTDLLFTKNLSDAYLLY